MKQLLTKLILLVTATIIIISYSACGDDNDGFDNPGSPAQVVSMRISENDLRLGSGEVLTVDFSFSAGDVFDDGDNIVLVVELPPALDFRRDTAELEGALGDNRVQPKVTLCPTSKKKYLEFDFNDDDLAFASNPNGDADAR